MNIYNGTYKVRTSKYFGDKQVYNLRDFIQYWKVFGFLEAIKELRKKTDKFYFIKEN